MNPIRSRRHPRNRFNCFARFRPLEAQPGDLDRLCVTRDFSHEGLYFLAFSDAVRLKMQLLLKFPYLADSIASGRECLIEVVRIKSIFPGRCGVGARLVMDRTDVQHPNARLLPETGPPNESSAYRVDLYI